MSRLLHKESRYVLLLDTFMDERLYPCTCKEQTGGLYTVIIIIIRAKLVIIRANYNKLLLLFPLIFFLVTELSAGVGSSFQRRLLKSARSCAVVVE